jgi:hypothetical protein
MFWNNSRIIMRKLSISSMNEEKMFKLKSHKSSKKFGTMWMGIGYDNFKFDPEKNIKMRRTRYW